MSARVMQVIQTETMRGKGIAPDDPCRTVIQYYTFDGELLAERDEWKEEQELLGWKEEQEQTLWKVEHRTPCDLCGCTIEPAQQKIAERDSNGQIASYHYGCWQYKNQQEYKATLTQEDPEQ